MNRYNKSRRSAYSHKARATKALFLALTFLLSAVTFAIVPAASYAITPPPQAVPDSFNVDFEDITWAGAITCNPDFREYECMPHVHEQIIAKGIDITGSPNGALITRLSVGPLGSTGVMIGYMTPSSTGEYVPAKDGLSEDEVLTVHFLYGLANSVEAGLATITSDLPNVSDVPSTVIMKAYDSDGSIIASQEETFTGVTNGQYTPARMIVATADSAFNISKVTVEVAPGSSLPFDGIFLQGLSFTKIDTQPIPDRPPAITVPNWSEEQPAVVGFDYEGAEVQYYIGSSTVAWDDHDGYITPVCDPPSGTFFPVGQHTVTCTATDSAGNVGTATFVVYVKDLADSALEEPFTPTAGVTSGRNTVYQVETNPSGIAVNSATNMVYVAGTNGNYLSIINATSKQVVDRVRIWNNPESVTLDESSNLIYVWASGQTTVIDGATNTILSKVSGTEQPPRNIATNSITGLTYQFEPGESFVSVTNSATGELVANVPVGNYAVALAIDESRNIIYVTNISDGTISIIDGSTNTVVDTLPAGGSPHGLAVNHNTNTVYASNWGQNTATAIDVSDVVESLPEYTPPPAGDDSAVEDNTATDNDSGEPVTNDTSTNTSSPPPEVTTTADNADTNNCDNVYAGTITSMIIDNGVQQFDPLATDGVTASASITNGYSVKLIIKAAEQSLSGNTEPGSVGYQTDAYGDIIGTCVPALPGEYVEVTLSNILMEGAQPESLQYVSWAPAPPDSTEHYYIHWQEDPMPRLVREPILTIRTQDFHGNEIVGYYVTQQSQDGQFRSDWSPARFNVVGGATNTFAVADYGQYAFDHWYDNGERNRERQLAITGDITITAVYRNINEPLPEPEPEPEPTPDPSPDEGEEVPQEQPSWGNQTPPPGKAWVMVWTRDGSTGERIDGYYSGVTKEVDGTTITSFSPTAFELDSGVRYSIWVADYGEYVFDHWQDTGSSTSERSLLMSDMETMELTAIYRNINDVPDNPPESPPPEEPVATPTSGIVRVSTVDLSGAPIYGYYTTLWLNGNQINSAFSVAEFTVDEGVTYQVAVADYGSYSFDQWSDGSRDRFRNGQAGDNLTAVYKTS